MSAALLFTIGGLTTIGLYLITARALSRIILGFVLLGHAAVVALLASGGPPGGAPIAGGGEAIANPVVQALALTAIVISFGLTLFLLALAGRQQSLEGDDLVEDDIEDRRVRRQAELDAARQRAAAEADGPEPEKASEADADTGAAPHPSAGSGETTS